MKKGIKLEISITQDILNRSSNCVNNVGQNCAIGLAIFEIFGAKSWVEADQILISNVDYNEGDIFLSGNVIAKIELPRIAQSFIHTFDINLPHERKRMAAFAFEIDVPENVIEMINIEEIYKVLETSTCLKLVEA